MIIRQMPNPYSVFSEHALNAGMRSNSSEDEDKALAALVAVVESGLGE
jgi:hypothetical protein